MHHLREVIYGAHVLAVDCPQVDEVRHGSAATRQGQTLLGRVPRYLRLAIIRDASDTNTEKAVVNTEGWVCGEFAD